MSDEKKQSHLDRRSETAFLELPISSVCKCKAHASVHLDLTTQGPFFIAVV